MTTDNLEFFEVFPWNENFETGIALIDEQHRQLVRLLNKLAAHLANHVSILALDDVFNELFAYVDYHFKSEENIWRTHFGASVAFEEHQRTHDGFIAKITELRASEGEKTLDEVIGDIVRFLTSWLAYHILDTDKRMAKVVFGLQDGLSLGQAQQRSDDEMSGAMRVLINTVLTMYDSLSSRTMDLMREKIARRLAEEALMESEERWKFILDGTGEGIWDWNLANGQIYRSSSDAPVLGFIGDEWQTGEDIGVHPDDVLRVMTELQAHLDGKTDSFVNEHRVVHKDGHWAWVLTRGKVTSRDADGKPLRMIGTHSDITERELAAMIFQNTSDGMMITDADNNIIAVNPAFTKITGYTQPEVVGQNPRILSSGRNDQLFYQKMWQQIKSCGQWEGEIWNRGKSGRVYPELLSVNSICNPDGTAHYHIGLFSDISGRKITEDLVWQQANFDVLTGLPNRLMLRDRLQQEVKKTLRSGTLMAVLFIDLDRFKEINTALGHAVGDLVIKEAAQRLADCIGDGDTLAHVGGDEFTVILTELGDPGIVERVAEEILRKLEAPFYIQNERLHISASIGITLFPEDANDAEDLLKHADQAMHAAKQAGRNRFSYFTQFMQEAAQIRSRLANDLRYGVENRQFVMHYQPIVELATGAIHKAEALVRWQHPTHGMINPTTFIPIAEETGAIVEIGNWVFHEAAQQAVIWRASHDERFQISVNKSPVQFRNDDEGNHHAAWFTYLNGLGLSGQGIVVEITEGLLMENNETIAKQLLELRDEGIQVALDDFGTGYSSLSYLNKFDIDYIKIDRSFVMYLSPDTNELALCEAIIAMAHKLEIKVIAEGIETAEQRDLLIKAGCDYGQGYLLSQPVPAKELESLFQ